jgi:hypothetical protein
MHHVFLTREWSSVNVLFRFFVHVNNGGAHASQSFRGNRRTSWSQAMPTFKRYDIAGLLGFTPIANVSDAQIWSQLLTPHVRGFLGDIKSSSGPHVMESVKGMFPGDEVTNLNNHRLYGGLSTETVRFPYITMLYRTTHGALVIKRDATKIKALCWFGDVETGKAQLICKGALRDRRFDGTLRANDTPLIDFPYDDPTFSRPLPVGTGVELSIYGFLPRSRISDILGPDELEYERFIGNPFAFMKEPEKFVKYFERAWRGGLSPGQIAAPIPDISLYVPQQYEKLARKAGYDYLENAASHYHVARWAMANGYRYSFQHDADTLAALAAGIQKIKATGAKLSRPQESWVCVVQSLRPVELIPSGLYLGGPEWPQNNLDQKNLWMNLALNEKAKALLPGPIKV